MVLVVEEEEEDEAVVVDVVEAVEDVDEAAVEEDVVEEDVVVTRRMTTLSLMKKVQLTTTTTINLVWTSIQTTTPSSQLKMVNPVVEADEEKLPMAEGEEEEGRLEAVVVDPLEEEKDVAEVDADVVEKEAVKREEAVVEKEAAGVVAEEERIADRIAPRRLWVSRTKRSPARKVTLLPTTLIIWKERFRIRIPTRIRTTTLPRRNLSSSLPLKRKRLPSQSIIQHPPSPCRHLLQPSLSKHAVECQ